MASCRKERGFSCGLRNSGLCDSGLIRGTSKTCAHRASGFGAALGRTVCGELEVPFLPSCMFLKNRSIRAGCESDFRISRGGCNNRSLLCKSLHIQPFGAGLAHDSTTPLDLAGLEAGVHFGRLPRLFSSPQA